MIDIKKLADIQPKLTGNEFSVLFYITNSCSYAQSIGLEYYEASYKQIREHTNIKDNHTIKSVLDHLVELGFITKQTEWSDEKNRKTKCKFTSSLVIPSGKNTLEIDSKSSGKNTLEIDSKSSGKNTLEIDSKSSGKNTQINKLNNINKSKLNKDTYNISNLEYKCENQMKYDSNSEIQRKVNNIIDGIDKGYFTSTGEIETRLTIDSIPSSEWSKVKSYYSNWNK